MNKQFFFHGNPSNLESTAKNIFDGLEEKISNEFFSSKPINNLSPYLVCEIKRWKNSLYSIYSYFCDGRDYSNRPNGHCVLTLIVENLYCRETFALYKLMELVYEGGLKKGLGYIDDSGKYLISSFYGKNDLDILQKDFYQRLDESSFKAIDDSFINFNSESSIATFNIEDTDSETFFSTFRKEGKVIVSSHVESTQERINNIRTNLNSHIVSLKNKINELEQENDKYRQEILNFKMNNSTVEVLTELEPERVEKKAKLKIQQLQIENDRLKKENEHIKLKYSTISKEKKEEGIIPQGSLLQQMQRKLKELLPIIMVGLLLINIWGTYREKGNVAEYTPIESDSIQSHIYKLKHSNDSLTNIINIYRAFANATIDIDGIQNGSINKNQNYTWKIKGSLLNNKGVLKVNDSIIKSNIYTPPAEGEEIWAYYYDEIEVKRRIVKVK